jgi:hypothetical protein
MHKENHHRFRFGTFEAKPENQINDFFNFLILQFAHPKGFLLSSPIQTVPATFIYLQSGCTFIG